MAIQTCEKCGKGFHTAGAKYCNECGGKLVGISEPRCVACGELISIFGDKFCPYCGTKNMHYKGMNNWTMTYNSGATEF